MLNTGNLAFVCSNVLAVIVALGLACALLPRRNRPQIALAALVGYPLVVILTLLLLGAVGLLVLEAAYFVMIPAAIVTIFCLIVRWRNRASAMLPSISPDVRDNEQLLQQLAVPIGLMAAFASVVMLKACGTGTQFFPDDLGYHGPTVADWVRTGHFTYVTRNFTAYYPFNCELLSLWYVLPFHADAWVALAGVVWLAMSACSAFALCRELELSPSTAALVAVLTICSPSIIWQVRTFSPADLAAASFILAGIYFASLACRVAKSSRTPEALYAGLLIGAAIGCKITVVPVLVVVLAALLLQRAPVRAVLVFCLGVLTTGAYWYLRNWTNTGNPLFPAAIGPFAGPWTSEQQSSEKLIKLVGHWPQLLAIIKKDFDWPMSLGVLSAVGFLCAISAELFRKGRPEGENLALRRLLLASGLAILAIYPFVPFSGNDNSWRYTTAPFLIGLVLYGRLIDERSRSPLLWRALAIIAIVTTWPGPGLNIVVAFVGGALGLVVLYLAVHRLRPASSTALVAGTLAGTIALFAGMAAATRHQQKATDEVLWRYGGTDQPIGLAWNALDELPPDSRIACFMNRSYDFLPLYGRRYQFQPVAVDTAGVPSLTLHERFARDPKFTMSFSKAKPPKDSTELLNNLRAATVNYVLVSKWPTSDWPPQYALLVGSDDVRVFYQDDYSVIWKLKHVPRQSSD